MIIKYGQIKRLEALILLAQVFVIILGVAFVSSFLPNIVVGFLRDNMEFLIGARWWSFTALLVIVAITITAQLKINALYRGEPLKPVLPYPNNLATGSSFTHHADGSVSGRGKSFV